MPGRLKGSKCHATWLASIRSFKTAANQGRTETVRCLGFGPEHTFKRKVGSGIRRCPDCEKAFRNANFGRLELRPLHSRLDD